MNGTPAARSRSSADRLDELHQRKRAFLHPRAARRRHDDERHPLDQRIFGRSGDLLADDRAHRTAHEPEVHDAQGDRPAVDRGRSPSRGVAHARGQLGCGDAIGVGLLVDEVERIDRSESRIALDERAVIDQEADPRVGRQAEVMAAVRANTLDLVQLLVEEHLLARRALCSEVGRVGVAAGPE